MLNTKTGEFSRQEIEHPYETAHRLAEWLRALAGLSTLSDSGTHVTEKAVKLLGSVACCIHITDSVRGIDRCYDQCTPQLEILPIKHLAATLKPKVALAGETILIDNLDSRFPHEEWIHQHHINKYLGVPLFSRSLEVAGVAAVFGTRSRRFNEEDESWLKAAGQAVLAGLNQDELERKLANLAVALTPEMVAKVTGDEVESQSPPPVILVVDDDRELNDMLTEQLTVQGYEVRQAFNGVEAMQVFQPSAHKLVITDVAMPLMNGWELVAALKVRTPNLPIVVMSGYSTGQWNPEYLNHRGVAAVLHKPFNTAELRSTVSRLLFPE